MWRELCSYPWRLALANLLLLPLPRMTFGWLRPGVYRVVGGVSIGNSTLFLGRLTLEGAGSMRRNLSVGSRCMFTTPLYLNLSASITIGNGVVIGHHVVIVTDTHDYGDPAMRGGPRRSLPVRIGDGVWIGARATILPGVTVGRGAVVAAGAVVTGDVASDAMVGGVPARLIRSLGTRPEASEPERS
jgi:maltose O-acetyltransferase